jgi:hypothetical protein
MIDSYSKSYITTGSPLQTSAVCLNKILLEKHDVLRLFAERIKRGGALDGGVRLSLIGDLYFINDQSLIFHEVP